MKTILTIVLLVSLQIFTCNTAKKDMKYIVKSVQKPILINAVWDKQSWNNIEHIELTHYMGSKPVHFPKTMAKMAYDENAVYIIFKVEDQYVRAVCTDNQGPVYKDSCVEFFFTPDEDVSSGYFNLEMNCGGTLLFHHKGKMQKRGINIQEEHIAQMEIAHSLPKIVEPEIEEKTTWVVEYKIPISILQEYHDVKKPSLGVIWKANFYKCADDTSHPHWLTWAPVENPGPNFHLPEFFDVLEFQ
jgi:hypothetical protein